MMQRTAPAAFLAVYLAGCAATPAAVMTWGKPGVSFEQYRIDSVECAIEGSSYDVEASKEYEEIDRGLKAQYRILELANGDQFDRIRDYTMTYQRNLRGGVADIQATMVDRVQMCLRARDYKEFALTQTQASKLASYRKGTEPRFRYLHSLASDLALAAPNGASKPDQ